MPSDVGGKNPELKKVGTTDYSLIMKTEFQEKAKKIQQILCLAMFNFKLIQMLLSCKWECGF
jgi:hypothetical protein